MTLEVFPGEWLGREVRVAGQRGSGAKRASGQDAPGERLEWVAPRRPNLLNLLEETNNGR